MMVIPTGYFVKNSMTTLRCLITVFCLSMSFPVERCGYLQWREAVFIIRLQKNSMQILMAICDLSVCLPVRSAISYKETMVDIGFFTTILSYTPIQVQIKRQNR